MRWVIPTPAGLGLAVLASLGFTRNPPVNPTTLVSSSLLLPSLELSDTKVYEPYIRALLGTASQFCEVVFLTNHTATSKGFLEYARTG